MEQAEQFETEEVVSNLVVYQQDKAQIDMQIATAKQYPRNIKRSTENAIAIVTMDMETAKSCTYSVPRGGKAVTGPSVHLAKILAQCWGNMRVDAKVVAIEAKTITSESVCFDLENNLAIKTQVKRSIMGKSGRFNDDMITVTGNAANSIALRNSVLSVIPKAVVEKAYNSAKQFITGDLSTAAKLIAKRKQVVDALRDTYNVTEKEILSAIGKAAVEHIDADDLVVLIGIGTAIKDGDTTVEIAFKGQKSTPMPDNIKPWHDLLIGVKTIEEFDALLAANKEVVDASVDITKLFDKKRNELLKPSAQEKAKQATEKAEKSMK